MKIYDIEKECGLEEAIANASVSFETELINDSKTKDYASAWLADKNLAEAHINDDDLYRVYSILVTSSWNKNCLLYTSPSPRDQRGSRMPSSA